MYLYYCLGNACAKNNYVLFIWNSDLTRSTVFFLATLLPEGHIRQNLKWTNKKQLGNTFKERIALAGAPKVFIGKDLKEKSVDGQMRRWRMKNLYNDHQVEVKV